MEFFIKDGLGRARGNFKGYPTLIDAMTGLREDVDINPRKYPNEYPITVVNSAGEVQYTLEFVTALSQAIGIHV